MPGARPRGFRFGDRGELLAESIISGLAFTTRVPRQEDVGHDLLCALIEWDSDLLRAGPFFTVQVKSNRGKIVYAKEHELNWIRNQENPFFICVAHRDDLTVEIYSTWNMLNGFLYRGASKVVLMPGGPDDEYQEVITADDGTKQIIPLGKPILRVSMEDTMNEDKAQTICAVLREWIQVDRENIVNQEAGMHWVVGPRHYETNRSLKETKDWRIEFFWNAKNLDLCRRNFSRSATALRLTIRAKFGPDQERIFCAEEVQAVEQAIRSNSDLLDPLAKKTLNDSLGLEI